MSDNQKPAPTPEAAAWTKESLNASITDADRDEAYRDHLPEGGTGSEEERTSFISGFEMAIEMVCDRLFHGSPAPGEAPAAAEVREDVLMLDALFQVLPMDEVEVEKAAWVRLRRIVGATLRSPAPGEAPADLREAAERLLDNWARWSIQIGPDAPNGFHDAVDYLRAALSKERPKGADPSDLLIHSIAKSAYLEGARDFYSGVEHNRDRDIAEWWLNSDAIRRNPAPTAGAPTLAAEKKPPIKDRTHVLKVHPAPFAALKARDKGFEWRKFDRDFRVGDTLILEEWDPAKGDYTGTCVTRVVTYLISGQFGIPADYCIMSLAPAGGAGSQAPGARPERPFNGRCPDCGVWCDPMDRTNPHKPLCKWAEGPAGGAL